MKIGACWLLEKYETPMNVAEALLLGKLSASEQRFVGEAIGSNLILQAAEARLRVNGQMKGAVCPKCSSSQG